MLYLDLALEAAGRSVIEARLSDIKAWAAGQGSDTKALLQLLAAGLENACMAFGSNQELVLCYTDLWVRACSGFTASHGVSVPTEAVFHGFDAVGGAGPCVVADVLLR